MSAFAATAAIVLFDVGAALDIGGFEIGRFPLYMAWAIAPAYLALIVSLRAADYFITGGPGHVLAMGSLLVWGLAFPAATLLSAATAWRASGAIRVSRPRAYTEGLC